ncbi:hypothetical protein AGMMS49944_08580 [Spirochaetia bacterium]|nr:hypothetical protein AGMMS49944_08580 [Spirochaetia bacterium]
MLKRHIIPVLLGVLVTAICAAQAAPGYPYAAAPANPGYNPYATAPANPGYNPYATAPASSGYNPYATAPANPGYNPYATAPASSGYNPYAAAPPNPGSSPYATASGYVPYASAPASGYNPYATAPAYPVYNPYAETSGPGAYTAAPPTPTSEITPLTPPWETGAIPWPVPWPTQAAREWMPELADPWIPGTGKPVPQVPVRQAPVQTPARTLTLISGSTPVYFIVGGLPAAKGTPAAVRTEPSVNMVKVVPSMPGPQDTTQYWVQVGAYKTHANAQEAFSRAAGAGFSPTFATTGGLVRVLIPGVRGSDMQKAAARLYNAGFREILLREKL